MKKIEVTENQFDQFISQLGCCVYVEKSHVGNIKSYFIYDVYLGEVIDDDNDRIFVREKIWDKYYAKINKPLSEDH